jgi:hypothetical protein
LDYFKHLRTKHERHFIHFVAQRANIELPGKKKEAKPMPAQSEKLAESKKTK